MHVKIFTTCFVFFQIQKALLYQSSSEDIGSFDYSENCYDVQGNVIVCPYGTNDPPRPDRNSSCLPDKPSGDLGPQNMKKRKRLFESNDCKRKDRCKRRYHIGMKLIGSKQEAQLRCEQMSDGTVENSWRLVSIESYEKWTDIVHALMAAIAVTPGYTARAYWISGTRKLFGPRDKFAWLSGCDFTYTYWAPGQPDDYKGVEGCVEITKTLDWNDFPCKNGGYYWKDYKKGYICESIMCEPPY